MAPAVRPRSSVIAAWMDGWRRAGRAPWLLIGVGAAVALTSGIAWPAWRATWLSWVFSNDATAFGGPLSLVWSLSSRGAMRALAFGRVQNLAVVDLSVVVLLFLSGGLIDRLARDRRVGTGAFFAVSGVAVMRFVRLSIILGAANWLLLQFALPAVMGLTPDMTPDGGWWQPRGLVVVIGVLALFGLALVGDYARVRIVVEDRHSAIGALGAAWRFMGRRPVQVLALYGFNLALETGAMTLAATILSEGGRLGPGPGGLQPIVVTATFVALAALQAAFKLGFVGATVAFFQAELAHAGYTASPMPSWPDSPAVEAIANMEARSRAGTTGPNFPL